VHWSLLLVLSEFLTVCSLEPRGSRGISDYRESEPVSAGAESERL
jgi:hypothetical protein